MLTVARWKEPTAGDITYFGSRPCRNQALLTRALSPWWLSYIVLQGAMKAAGSQIQWSHPALDLTCYNTDLLGKMRYCCSRDVIVMRATRAF